MIFLGGACGETTWRKDIAIPALTAAGVSYFDPQLPPGMWTEEHEALDIKAKGESDVLLFVVNNQTRGVATIGEVAYCLGSGQPVVLVLNDIGEDDYIDGKPVSRTERDDLNRGRIFLRTTAAAHEIPIFDNVAEGVQHAIELIRTASAPLTADSLASMLSDVQFEGSLFLIEELPNGFHIQLQRTEADVDTGEHQEFQGRKWYVDRHATPGTVVRTAFKAVLTWQEHEARDRFTYRGARLFSPHSDVDRLVQLNRKK